MKPGSPAPAELPAGEREPKLGWRTVPVTDDLMAPFAARGLVMLHESSKATFGRRGNRHYRLRRDDEGWYVRVGKRAQSKRRLVACEITYADGKPILHQFKTDR